MAKLGIFIVAIAVVVFVPNRVHSGAAYDHIQFLMRILFQEVNRSAARQPADVGVVSVPERKRLWFAPRPSLCRELCDVIQHIAERFLFLREILIIWLVSRGFSVRLFLFH